MYFNALLGNFEWLIGEKKYFIQEQDALIHLGEMSKLLFIV